jgi:hypothetical protein
MQQVLYFLEFGFSAPPVLAGNRKTAFRYLAELLIYPAGEENRRRIPSAFALMYLWALL